MKLAFIMSSFDHTHSKYKHGVWDYLIDNLKKNGVEILTAGGHKVPFLFFFKLKKFFYLIFGKKYLRDRDIMLLKTLARKTEKDLNQLDYDAIFSFGSIPSSFINTEKPIIFWTDAVFASLLNYYDVYSNVCKESKVSGNKIEQAAFDKCSLAIFSTEWALNGALEHYKISKDKLKVANFGANIKTDRNLNDISNFINKRSRNAFNFLLLGKHWKRKGGDIAYRIVEELNKRGSICLLNIVGCLPDLPAPYPKFLNVHGFIKKNNKSDDERFNDIISESHFLLLPSRAETFGHVFCEANSFGVPCIASKTGGIPEVVIDGKNGILMDLNEEINFICDRICFYLDNFQEYKELCINSFREYENRLNWDSAIKKVVSYINETINKPSA